MMKMIRRLKCIPAVNKIRKWLPIAAFQHPNLLISASNNVALVLGAAKTAIFSRKIRKTLAFSCDDIILCHSVDPAEHEELFVVVLIKKIGQNTFHST